jgi:hypothetical protein
VRRPAVLLVLLATALPLVGCQENSDGFDEAMSAFCRSFDQRARDLSTRTVELNRELDESDARYLGRVRPLLEEGVALNDEALAGLRGVPAERDVEVRRLERLRGAVERQQRLLRRLVAAARAGDRPAFARLQEPLAKAGADRQRAVGLLMVDGCLV